MHRQRRSNRSLSRCPGWILWKQWVLATAIAEMVGLSFLVAIDAAMHQIDPMYVNSVVMGVGALEGFTLGFFQWLVLRRYLKYSIWWIVVTTIGTMLTWVLMLGVALVTAIVNAGATNGMSMEAYVKGVAVLGMGVGGMLGFAQWLVLQMHSRRAAWWIVANILAWSLGLIVSFMGTEFVKHDSSSLHAILIGAAIGCVVGTMIGSITGVILVWLLQSQASYKWYVKHH